MKPLNIFILEDEIDRAPRNEIVKILAGHNLTIAKSKGQAVEKYDGGYDLLLLDHDMRGFFDSSNYPNCGFQFVLWLVEHEIKRPNVILHSQNAEGRSRMAKELTKAGFQVMEDRFGPEFLKNLKEVYAL